MAKGTNYSSERAIFTDPQSGLRITRLTHSACIGSNLYFEMCSFTEDDSHVVLISQRGAGRDVPWDLFRVQTDGMELVQITERDDLSGIVFCPRLGSVLYQSSEELIKLDILSLDEKVVAEVPGERLGTVGYSLATIDLSGSAYFGIRTDPEGGESIFKADVGTGNMNVLHHSDRHNHLHVDPAGKTLQFNSFKDGQWKAHLIDADGRNLRPSCFDQFAHRTWFGSTGKMQGTLLPPGKALALCGEADLEPTILAEDRYYWHSAPSSDAQWIVSDTNWPQEGLYLLHVPTGRVSYVCDPRASCSHPQWTHPHPSLSPGMRHVLFNSDLTGIGQVYLAELTDEFLEQAQQPAVF